MAEVTDYSKLLPIKPPEGLLDWCYKQKFLGGEYIVYRSGSYYEPLEGRNIRAVRCTCTACGETSYQTYEKPVCFKAAARAPFGFIHPVTRETILSGDAIECPMCGEKVTVRHCRDIGAQNGSQIGSVFPLTIHNIQGNLALLCWYVERRIDNWGKESVSIKPYDGYLFMKDKKIRFTGRESGFFRTYYINRWKQLKSFQDKVGPFRQQEIFPWDKSILNGTAAENCKLDMYIDCDEQTYPVSYMQLWYRYPNIENLIMQGFGKFINDKLRSTISYGSIAPKLSLFTGLHLTKSKPTDILGISKDEMRYIKKNHWSSEKLDFYIHTKNQGITFENINKIQKNYSSYDVNPLVGLKVNIPKALRYLTKQRRKFKHFEINSRYLVDYWNMAKENGDDLTDESIRFPHNLKTAHDSAQRLIELKASEKRAKDFDRRYKELKKYCFASGGLSIHPAQTETEMINEGKFLHHCVGTYAKRYAQGDTSIFFIRHESEPDVPYFTLEYDFRNMRVVQNRGMRNCARTDEVREFEDKWVQYVNSITKNERRAA